MNILLVWLSLVILMVVFVEFLFWTLDVVIYLFQKRQDKILMEQYIENPVEMTSDKNEVFWVGYKK